MLLLTYYWAQQPVLVKGYVMLKESFIARGNFTYKNYVLRPELKIGSERLPIRL